MIEPSKIRPYAGRVLVERDPHDTMTRGGLHIPERVQSAASPGSTQHLKRGRGVVLAVGNGALETRERTDDRGNVETYYTGRRIAPDVKVGDRVMFSRLADGGDLDAFGLGSLTLLDADEIIGVLGEGETDAT